MQAQELDDWIEREGRWEFSRSGGPGGQNVNKVNTRATLRLPIARLPLSEDDLRLLRRRLAGRLTREGELLIHSSQARSQRANRRHAHDRALELISAALVRRRKRSATQPTRAAVERRIAEKKRRARLKRDRRPPA